MKNNTFFFLFALLGLIIGVISFAVGKLAGFGSDGMYTNYLIVVFCSWTIFNQWLILRNQDVTKNEN